MHASPTVPLPGPEHTKRQFRKLNVDLTSPSLSPITTSSPAVCFLAMLTLRLPSTIMQTAQDVIAEKVKGRDPNNVKVPVSTTKMHQSPGSGDPLVRTLGVIFSTLD